MGSSRCLAGELAGSQLDDDLEENDTFGTATRVSGPAYTRGALRACPADLDVFRIALVVGQQVSVRVRFTHADGDIDAYLFNPNTTNFSRR